MKKKIKKAMADFEHKKPRQGFFKGKATTSVDLTNNSTIGKAKMKENLLPHKPRLQGLNRSSQ